MARIMDEYLLPAGYEFQKVQHDFQRLMQGKALNYNSRMSVWHPARNTMANTFDRHDYAFKWTHGEFEGARELYRREGVADYQSVFSIRDFGVAVDVPGEAEVSAR